MSTGTMSKRDRPEALELPLFDLPLYDAGQGVSTGNETGDDLDLDIDAANGADIAEKQSGTNTPAEPSGLAGLEADSAEIGNAGDLLIAHGSSPPASELDSERVADATKSEVDAPTEEETPARLRERWLAGLLDLGIQLLVLSAAVAAVRWMSVPVTVDDWIPFAGLALIFSFLYWFIPLAFWGQTPGMAWVGHSAMSQSTEPLTFGQSVLRWIGALLTLAFLGLPLLLVLGHDGRSLTDRLSDSKTVTHSP